MALVNEELAVVRNTEEALEHLQFLLKKGSKPEITLKFFISTINQLGFNYPGYLDPVETNQKLKNCVATIGQLFDVLSKSSVQLDTKFDTFTFEEYIEELMLSIFYTLRIPNEDSFKILQSVIAIQPLLIEKRIEEVLDFIFLSNYPRTLESEKTITSIFEVFFKLHRIPQFISKMLPIIKQLLKKVERNKPSITFHGEQEDEVTEHERSYKADEILPENVLKYFAECIISLASWQIINLFKTLLFHLQDAVSEVVQKTGKRNVFYVEFIGILMCRVLFSVRIAEHTVPDTFVIKFVDGMESFRKILEELGTLLVNMKHNIVLMKMFLNMCYVWGEVYIMLEYYSVGNESIIKKSSDTDNSACNITYLHSYLNRDQWCLISERIANFGEKPCKEIMQKLFVQKFKAMLLLENNTVEEVRTSLIRSLTLNLEHNWELLLSEQFTIEEIVAKMDYKTVTSLANLLLTDMLENNSLPINIYALDCEIFRNALLNVCMKKLNKCFKRKRKLDGVDYNSKSARFFEIIPEDFFFDQGEEIEALIHFFKQECSCSDLILSVNEAKFNTLLEIVQYIPVTYCSNNIILCVVMYFTLILIDLHGLKVEDDKIKHKIELVLKGLLQQYSGSFKSIESGIFSSRILKDSTSFPNLLAPIIDIILREDNVKESHPDLNSIFKDVPSESVMKYAVIIFNSLIKHKKIYKAPDNKKLMGEYQMQISNLIISSLTKDIQDETATEAFALVLKFALTNQSKLLVEELMSLLQSFVSNSMERCMESKQLCIGDTILYTTLIRHKSTLKIEDDFVVKVWNVCKNSKFQMDNDEGLSELIVLIFEHVEYEQFESICNDLLAFTLESIERNQEIAMKSLNVWRSIVTCNFNNSKTKTLLQKLEHLLNNILFALKRSRIEFQLLKVVVDLNVTLVQTVQLILTPTLLDQILITNSLMMHTESDTFVKKFNFCYSILKNLLKYRKQLITDRLPSFCQQYRHILKALCLKSNSDLKLEPQEVQDLSDCAHKLEQLTNIIVGLGKNVLIRLCPYFIAEILKQYETITLIPNVKIHLNNCIYSYISLCDQYSLSYSTRILSTASSEMFKTMFENYKKYYKFTGKV